MVRGPANDEHDVLAMLDSERVASNIVRLLLAAAAFALIWAVAAGAGTTPVLAATAFGGTALGFVAWQRLAPGAEGRVLLETGLYVGAVLVLASAAVAGIDDSPFLLFLIWLIPWAFVTWSRARAIAYVAVIAAACTALLAAQTALDAVGFARHDVPTLLVGLGGLVAVGLVVRLVVDRLLDSHLAARAAAARQADVAELARRALGSATSDGSLIRAAANTVGHALAADTARVVSVASEVGAGLAESRNVLLLPVDDAGKDRRLFVMRNAAPFRPDEIAFARAVADVLAVAARRMALEDDRRIRAGQDELTGLAGRERFANALAAALSADGEDEGATVLVVDIDDFVLVNETLGPTAGDHLLRAVGERLRDCAGEDATVARFGGDEFAVLAPGMSREVLAVDLAKRVQGCLRPPFDLAGARHHATASVGITICGRGGDPRGAIRDAHLAQRRARERGRGRYEVFNAGLRHRLEQRRSVEQELRGALEQQQFALVYQPVVDLTTGRVRGVEALLRWNHPERGVVSPAEFIDVAEASDLIVPIGAWALRESLRQLKAWAASLPALDDFRLGVNVSGRQLADGRFVALLRRQLANYDLDPRMVACELTETALTDESPQVETAVGQIKALGVKLALDDFGTGYASLRYLRRFAFDSLKLDRSFVGGLGTDPDDTALVAAAISMGDALNMEVVAEGVEEELQAQRLRAMGCDLAQGFLFSRPVDAARVRALLTAQALGERPLGLPAAGGELAERPAGDRDADAGTGTRLARKLETPAEGIDPLAR